MQIGSQAIAVNRVRALDLAQALAREFSKAAWRDAYADALARWRAEGHSPQRLPSASKSARRPRFAYSEEE